MDPKQFVPLLAQLSLVLIVASFGLQARMRDVGAAMRDWPLVAKGVVAVNVVVPIAALLACSILPIDPAVRIGIVIMAVSPLAPLLPGKMQKAGMSASAVAGLYVALILVAVLLVPATVALLDAIYPAAASISVAAVGRLVLVTTLLPLAAGLMIATLAPQIAPRLARIASIVGFLGIALILLLVLYAHGAGALGLIGDGSVLAIAVAVAAGITAGHLLGSPDKASSNALAMAAAIRHPGIAALIVGANFQDPKVMLAVVLFLLTSIVVSAIYQRWILRPSDSKAGIATAQPDMDEHRG